MLLVLDVPASSPFDDLSDYVPLLISAVEGFLLLPELWAEDDYPDAYNHMQELIYWLATELPCMTQSFPEVAVFNHMMAVVTNGNAIALVPDTAQVDATQFRQNVAANGDKFEHKFFARSGIYTLHQIGIRNTNAGIVEWSVDGTAYGTIDWYGALARNYNQNLGSVSVLTDGLHTLQGEIVGKNTSSSAYILYLNWYWLERIQDL